MRIGELAGLAGVSTRTVRHYHRIGLLPEPRRRENGYRSYELRDLVLLLRTRRLVELGLSLEEVADALSDDRGRDLVEIVREIDADLAAQQDRITRQRAAIADLLAADGDLRSPALLAVLDTLTDHPARERESLAAELIESLTGRLDLYHSVQADFALRKRMLDAQADFERLVDVSPADPAVDELAARAREFGPAVAALLPPDLPTVDADPEMLLAAVSAGMAPAQVRCLRLMFSYWQEDMA
ncbi:MerR family transcriptional regulator [Kutzneria kofuensis]|uniref:DNA-binding transcriptional MerR regulator n=1 Tax=Kutzneria kofuensis TaxID=103725 RepID=A0A7W9KM15_9PSEU|nr:MerR family transcriptional regulator [Kutzneria kofuensis]MBB5895037.1 DNA-binding transcriptional MerR regulator [Kutzneria kofuensis]